MSKQDGKIVEQAGQFLDPGETVLGAIIARPRGWTQTHAGALHVGAHQQGKHRAAGEAAGLELASPMALAVTGKRVVVFGISSPIGMGKGGDIKELVSDVPLAEVDSIAIKRLLLGKVVTVTVGGTPIKLEVNAAADAKGLVEAFDSAKGGVALA
jgi:hypothetical protein